MGDLLNPPFKGDAFLRTAPATNNGYAIIVPGGSGLVQVKVGNTTTDYDANNLCNTLG
jgi:hypothetical protein